MCQVELVSARWGVRGLNCAGGKPCLNQDGSPAPQVCAVTPRDPSADKIEARIHWRPPGEGLMRPMVTPSSPSAPLNISDQRQSWRDAALGVQSDPLVSQWSAESQRRKGPPVLS